MTRTRSDLSMAQDMMGRALCQTTIDKIMTLVESPSQETWDAAHGLILSPHPGMGLTLWQAILAVDPTFPQSGKSEDSAGNVLRPWPRIPEPDLVRRAVFYATH